MVFNSVHVTVIGLCIGAGLWMSEESVGDAGPSNLGYFGGVWSPDGSAILAHGYTGALHLWRRQGMTHSHVRRAKSYQHV